MCQVIVNCCRDTPTGRIVPIIGPISPAPESVIKTPERLNTRLLKGELLAMAQITASQRIRLSAKFIDKHENPAPVDGKPEWFTSNSEVVAVTVSDDGLSCLAAAVGPIGSAIVSLSADADMGDGVKNVVGSIDVNVTAGEATQVVIDAGEPEEQP